MKIKFILPLFVVSVLFALVSFTSSLDPQYIDISDVVIIDIPENVKAIIDNKCMECHSNEAKNGKSKMKMNFDKLSNGDYSTGKVISKLDKIVKMLGKDKMPPEKFLAKNPDKKLSSEESKLISDWASGQSSMMKGE
ncbi:MAG: heme-binding domain-containing protein [Flavobacteriaceae bacterium]|nr:heme-binding domain-containing protein [Flavobacteriaceae bacterium]